MEVDGEGLVMILERVLNELALNSTGDAKGKKRKRGL